MNTLLDMTNLGEYAIDGGASFMDLEAARRKEISDNLIGSNTEKAETIVKPVPEATQTAPEIKHTDFPTTSLEALYEATKPEGTRVNFNGVVDFLGNIAEAESRKGVLQSNSKSSADGIFHFLIANGGGYNQLGQRTTLGQYDKQGKLKTSSFETAKSRLTNLVDEARASGKLSASPDLDKDLAAIMKSPTPRQLTPHQQGLLAYGYLKKVSDDFDSFLVGNKRAEDVYGKAWVTYKTNKELSAIRQNFSRAKLANIKEGGLSNLFNFFNIIPKQYVDAPGTAVFAANMREGGVLSNDILNRINAKRTLI